MGLLLLLLAGAVSCTLGPDPRIRPKTAADDRERFIEDGREVAEGAESAKGAGPANAVRWWESFGDATLNELVAQSLAANHDLKAAAARVLAARAEARAAFGVRLPALDATLSADRRRFSFVLPQVGRVGIWSTTLANQLSVSYQLDLFGKLARLNQAAWAGYLESEANRLALSHTVVGSVARLRVSLGILDRQIEATESEVGSYRRSLRIVDSRYRRGIAPSLDLRLARQSLASAEAALADLELRQKQAGHALDILLGRAPGTGADLPQTMPELPPLEAPPSGMPVALLDRRPDLVASRMRFQVATARVGASLADLFPSLPLSAGFGHSGDDTKGLTASANAVYSLAGNLLAPILHGGALRAKVRASRAIAEAAAEDYAGAVLRAMGEVEDALAADQLKRRQLDSLRLAAAEGAAAARLAEARYERGAGTLLVMLESERRELASRQALLRAQDDAWNARIDLYLALGGDFTGDESLAVSAKETPETSS